MRSEFLGAYADFANRFLLEYDRYTAGHAFLLTIANVADGYGVSREEVPYLMDALERAGLVTMSAFDGSREKPRRYWENRRAFFHNTAGGGVFKVTRTPAGYAHARKYAAEKAQTRCGRAAGAY